MLTIQEARKTLGKKGEKMTDEQVQKMINLLTRLANEAIDRWEKELKEKLNRGS